MRLMEESEEDVVVDKGNVEEYLREKWRFNEMWDPNEMFVEDMKKDNQLNSLRETLKEAEK